MTDKKTDEEVELSALRKMLELNNLMLGMAEACLTYYAHPEGDDNEEALACLKKIADLRAKGVGS